ncbi:Hypothetical predicted protein [Octopus vulgaris]|uniref:Uncharacterized protein n=1 Tax=Octopus vulgaris TaxID=6645 RepID=A0AA36B6T2_OCTVU|nr:Hypothetical predicted protein [Octopus vulgaris]
MEKAVRVGLVIEAMGDELSLKPSLANEGQKEDMQFEEIHKGENCARLECLPIRGRPLLSRGRNVFAESSGVFSETDISKIFNETVERMQPTTAPSSTAETNAQTTRIASGLSAFDQFANFANICRYKFNSFNFRKRSQFFNIIWSEVSSLRFRDELLGKPD